MVTKLILHKGLHYRQVNGMIKKYPAWIGDSFAIFYDRMMEKRVFPKMFGSDMEKHYAILRKSYASIRSAHVLELGTGSGDVSAILHNKNTYDGVDISAKLLRRAKKRFVKAGFKEARLYAMDVTQLPFEDGSFDYALCNLSLNFFDDLKVVIAELGRVLKTKGTFICSVPIPERNRRDSMIRGRLYTEQELKRMFVNNGFTFNTMPEDNGTLLYFEATKE